MLVRVQMICDEEPLRKSIGSAGKASFDPCMFAWSVRPRGIGTSCGMRGSVDKNEDGMGL